MSRQLRRMAVIGGIAGLLALSGNAWAQTPSKGATQTKATTSATTAAPTDQEISDAKAKGLVWVNTSSKVYHKEGQYYGKTKRGKFMTEADAQKAGYKLAQEPQTKKQSSPPKK